MSDHLIERTARAMFERHTSVCMSPLSWEELTERAKDGYREDARTAARVLQERKE